jgi:DNA-binding transcriptional MerR regulator
MSKALEAFRTISEVADDLDVPKHVLRFWEVKFPQIRPMKRGGGRRYYRPEDMVLLRGIQHLLHAEGYTIKGVQKILREQGIEQVKLHGLAAAAAGQGAVVGPSGKQSGVAAAGRLRALPTSMRRGRSGGPEAVGAVIAKVVVELKACRQRLMDAGSSAKAAPAKSQASLPAGRSKTAR